MEHSKRKYYISDSNLIIEDDENDILILKYNLDETKVLFTSEKEFKELKNYSLDELIEITSNEEWMDSLEFDI